ncbi:MAG TPA: alpha/beta fold hydrolase [Bacteroidia bacterium]|nr:alpha/beta fold hydrolase [Bacteroidia bacterium]
MNSKKLSFKNRFGETLEGVIDLPFTHNIVAYAIFAHCFTCGKNLFAARQISRTLALKGIAVLRFDFTGIGESEGTFEDTNFTTNVTDIEDAAKYLEENYEAPSLVIGHSLGGAAVLFSAQNIPSIKAVVTIAAPSSPDHIMHLFRHSKDEIMQNEKATMMIAGREITIKKQFIEDVMSLSMDDLLRDLHKPILILHSPTDNIVGINNAAEIYKSANHPKSFVSLDGADHLLKIQKDSEYVSTIISSWATRYLDSKKNIQSESQVDVYLNNDKFTTEVVARKHLWIADEPTDAGGNDLGPTPYELLSSALATCTAITLKMYAKRKNWKTGEIKVMVEHGRKYADDCEYCDNNSKLIEVFKRTIVLDDGLDAEKKNRLHQIADHCPVHKTLSKSSKIETTI